MLAYPIPVGLGNREHREGAGAVDDVRKGLCQHAVDVPNASSAIQGLRRQDSGGREGRCRDDHPITAAFAVGHDDAVEGLGRGEAEAGLRADVIVGLHGDVRRTNAGQD